MADLKPDPARMVAQTTHGSAPFAAASFKPANVFVFGAETCRLAPALRKSFPPAQRIGLPVRPDNRRLHVSNAVAVVVYEAWRQNRYSRGA